MKIYKFLTYPTCLLVEPFASTRNSRKEPDRYIGDAGIGVKIKNLILDKLTWGTFEIATWRYEKFSDMERKPEINCITKAAGKLCFKEREMVITVRCSWESKNELKSFGAIRRSLGNLGRTVVKKSCWPEWIKDWMVEESGESGYRPLFQTDQWWGSRERAAPGGNHGLEGGRNFALSGSTWVCLNAVRKS